MEFKRGDRIKFPDPLEDEAMTDGTFHEIIDDPSQMLPDPAGDRKLDTAWVSRAEDSTTARVAYNKIRPA